MNQSSPTRSYGAYHNRLSRRRILAAAAMSGGAAALLAACGGRATRTTPSAGSGAVKPQPGGQINLATPSDPFDLDPTTGEQNSRQILPMVYDSLLAIKAAPDVKYNDLVLGPGLADRWETPDGQTFTFHLHPGATFANLPPANGRPVTASDVKWSLEYVARIGSFKGDKKLKPALYASNFEGLEAVETPDANTVVVRFDAPYIPFLSYAAADWAPVMPHEIYDKDGNFSGQAVGSGAWQVDNAASQRGSHWTLKRNQTYFRQGRPYIDQVNWLVLHDTATQAAAFTTKQIDMLPGDGVTTLDYPTVQKAKSDNPGATVYTFLNPSSGILYWNTRKPPLSDERIRKAISLCINREELIKTLSGEGQGQWALAGTLPGVFADDEVHKRLSYDPAQAAKLVADAGYPNGVSINFMLNTEGGQTLISLVQLVQAQLKRGNIDAQIESVTRETDNARRHSLNYQLSYTPKILTFDIDSYLVGEFYSKSDHNYMGINDPALDKLVLAQRSETDTNKRLDLIRQAVRLVNDHAYALAFYYPTGHVFTSPRLKSYNPNWGALGPPLVDSWLAS
ncbi:MAG TPA: ABC transporter substrate-binding protein [Dehalococcoidia bacterium]|nr:ABC transporter substrate-binding protein [Dehalococcoidia bacterium]